MKKIICVAAAIVFVLCLTACAPQTKPAGEEDKSGSSASVEKVEESKDEAQSEKPAEEEPKAEQDSDTFVCDDFTAKFLSYSVVKDYEDKDVLRLVFEYTNTSDDTASFIWDSSVKAFQNGVELDMAFVLEEDKEYSNSSKEVKPGTTINVASLFELTDKSDVEIEVSELISFSNNKLVKTLTID